MLEDYWFQKFRRESPQSLRQREQTSLATTATSQTFEKKIIKRKIYSASTLDAQLEATQYGVKVFKMKEGSVLKKIGIPENFTIIAIIDRYSYYK